MHIFFVSNNYTPYTGGVVSAINTSIAELQKQGHTVTLITLDFLGNKHHDPVWVRRIPSLIRFRFKHNHMALPWRPGFYLQYWMRQLKPDVVHVHHPFLLGPLAVRIAKKLGIATIFTYHTLYQAYAHYVLLPVWVTKPIIEKRVLSFCKEVDHIIAPSNGIQQYLQCHSIHHSTVLPTGVAPLFSEQHFIPKEIEAPYELLYVGRLTKEKNIPFLLDVMAQLPEEYRITLVGYGHYLDYVQAYAYDFHRLSPNRVRFIIQPDKQIVLAAYQKAHLFLFPSMTDTQGLVLAEAMASSTPVIAVDGYGQRDIIQHGINGFIVQNVVQMTNTITAVMHNRAQYTALQHGAYMTAKRYTSATYFASLMALYKQRTR